MNGKGKKSLLVLPLNIYIPTLSTVIYLGIVLIVTKFKGLIQENKSKTGKEKKDRAALKHKVKHWPKFVTKKIYKW